MKINPSQRRLSRRNKLEIIRYVWDELCQRRAQGSIWRILKYISQVYEEQIKNNNDLKNENLTSEINKLTQKLKYEKETKIELEKELRKEIKHIKEQHK